MSDTGKDEKGRFTQANTFGKGRPPKAKELARLAVLQEVVTLDAWRQVCAKALRDALGVKLVAGPDGRAVATDDPDSDGATRERGRRFIIEYTIGKASQNITIGDDLLAVLDDIPASDIPFVIERAEALIRAGIEREGGAAGAGADAGQSDQPNGDGGTA